MTILSPVNYSLGLFSAYQGVGQDDGDLVLAIAPAASKKLHLKIFNSVC